MILADKIIDLRKKAGCSQEELAQQLGVSRQSVSKWEGAQSIPDIDKILQMSRIFGVSTDYLLKDEIELPAEEPAAADSTPALRRVSMEEASRYLALSRETAPKLALATTIIKNKTAIFSTKATKTAVFGVSSVSVELQESLQFHTCGGI